MLFTMAWKHGHSAYMVCSNATASFEVHVLGGVGEQRQPPERADQVELVLDRPAGQRGRKGVEWAATAAAGVDGAAAHVLDEVEDLGAGLLADDVTEQAAEQADVAAERLVLARVGPVAVPVVGHRRPTVRGRGTARAETG